jgi:hypothetical protein
MSSSSEMVAEWERARKNPNYTPPYKVMMPSGDGVNKGCFMVATRNIMPGEAILVEEPLLELPHRLIHESVQNDPAFIQTQDAMNKLVQSGKTKTLSTKEKSQCKLALRRMEEMRLQPFVEAQHPDVRDQIWDLADGQTVFQTGDKVMVHSLQSKEGKTLNGRFGHVLEPDEKDPNRWGIELDKMRLGQGTQIRSIQTKNLKSLYGIMRTNGFQSTNGTQAVLYKTCSRINHACLSASNAARGEVNGKACLIPMKCIREGEEILIDYITGHEGTTSKTGRVEELEQRYNFVCDCAGHNCGIGRASLPPGLSMEELVRDVMAMNAGK